MVDQDATTRLDEGLLRGVAQCFDPASRNLIRGRSVARAVIGFLAGAVIGVVAGAGAMLLAFPFLFPPDPVNETVADMAGFEVVPLVDARFREGVSGQDAAHWGRGGVRAYRAQDGNVLVELQPDFEVGPGPNFWLYLNSVGGIDDERDFAADDGRRRVAKLKSFVGSQVYSVGAEEFESARAITVWCESFGQYIASADLGGIGS